MHIGPYALRNPWILAPMAGVSEMPFRCLALACGAAAAPTELVSAKGLLYGQARTARYLAHGPQEQPFWVQIFGGDAVTMAAGAQRAAELGARIIDINMGCPVKKVTKNGAGSALLTDPARAAALVRAVAGAGLPVTVKIRAGWDEGSVNCLEVGRALADAGCAAVAMHARTRAQGYSGRANWRLIAELVAALPIPVIGNGDADSAAAARRLQEQTGCAAVMIGRGAMGNPWIFSELAQGTPAPPPAARWETIAAHLAAHIHFVGDERMGVRRFRPHLMWYSHGLVGAAALRARINRIESLAELLPVCAAFFASAAAQPAAGAAPERSFDTRCALG